MEPAIDIERFAALSAELDAGAQRDELCAREGISTDDWTQVQEAWLSKLADDTARKRYVLTNRYNAAFVERRRALTYGDRPAPGRRARPARPAPPKSAPPPAEQPAAVAPPPPIQVPSYAVRSELGVDMGSSPGVAPPIVAPPPVAQPSYARAEAPVAPPMVAPPPLVSDAAETAQMPPVAPAPAAKPRRGATIAMPAFTDPVGAPLPFKPAPPGAPPAPPPPRASDRPPRPADDGSITASGPSPFAASRPATPFDKRAPSPGLGETAADVISPFASGPAPLPFQRSGTSPPVAQKPPAPVAQKPPAKIEEPAPDATVYGAISPFASGAAPLPFQPSTPAEPRPAGQQSSGALPFQNKPSTPAIHELPSAGSVRPSPSMVATGQRLTLEQFASLTAEIAVSPRSAAQIRARYGLDEPSHAAEAEKYNRRFNVDKPLYDRYIELFQSYRDYVARANR